MKLIKGLLILVLTFSIVPNLNVQNASAAWVNGGEDILDNDNNKLESSDNSYSGNWVHENSGNSYRSDHRILKSPPSSSWVEYSWYYPTRSGLYGSISVYLWDVRFNNENASYRMYSRSSSGSSTNPFNKYVNQRTAAGGWNYIGKTTSAQTGPFTVVVSATSSGGTGADGTKVRYSTS